MSRSEAARAEFDGARRDILDVAQALLDTFADHPLERVARLFGQLGRSLGDCGLDRLAGTLRGMGGRFLHLKQRGNKRRPGLGAERRRFALDLDQGGGELGEL